MAVPLMLGGIEILPYAGAPVLTEGKLGGGTGMVRLSGGTAVKMERYSKRFGSISGSGLVPSGLDGLAFSGPLELRTTKVRIVQGAGLEYELPCTPRPDLPPWAYALVDGRLRRAACSTLDGVTTVTAVDGATQYQVWFMPVYSVMATPPDETQDHVSRTHSWSLSWEEA